MLYHMTFLKPMTFFYSLNNITTGSLEKIVIVPRTLNRFNLNHRRTTLLLSVNIIERL